MRFFANNGCYLQKYVKDNVEDIRDYRRSQVDPMSLQDTIAFGDVEYWKVSIVKGLGKYSFEGLDVDVDDKSATRI